ncbi:MAG: DUF362 domain-containing protein [Verrucomicrobiota bacterium]|nr:DUF362 domain-containing protein [Verrucomicrobiota bacterium]
MSRNAQSLWRSWLTTVVVGFSVAQTRAAGAFAFGGPGGATARVVVVQDPRATVAFQPDTNRVQAMVNRGIMEFTGRPTPAGAWRSVVSTNDVVGIKVFSAAGAISGTRPAVVAAVVRGLLDAGLPPRHIIIWDKRADDLRAAGFFALAAQLGVRAAGAVETGYDPTNFYLPDSPVIGQLLWGDLEFGKKGPDVGKRSFVTKLLSREITRVISIAPLLNQNDAGVCGQLYSLAMGSVDNTLRFQDDPGRLAVAVPEIYALPSVGDKVALNITDALLGQYEGGDSVLLHYATALNQLWFSRDPVALDTLALRELDRERRAAGAPEFKPDTQIYTNAVLLQLGVGDPAKIKMEKIIAGRGSPG